MTSHRVFSAAAALVLVSGSAAFAQSGTEYGSKSAPKSPGYEVVVVETDHYVAADVYVAPAPDYIPPHRPYGCVMGMGVMQRGTLICPGH